MCIYLYKLQYTHGLYIYYDNNCVRNVIIICENREVISLKNCLHYIIHEIVFIIFLRALHAVLLSVLHIIINIIYKYNIVITVSKSRVRPDQ